MLSAGKVPSCGRERCLPADQEAAFMATYSNYLETIDVRIGKQTYSLWYFQNIGDVLPSSPSLHLKKNFVS